MSLSTSTVKCKVLTVTTYSGVQLGVSLTGEMEYTDWNVEWNGGIELDYLLYILTTSKILMADQSFILHGNVSQHILLLILSTS